MHGTPTSPLTYPFDLGEDGVNRPGLHLHPTYHAVRESGTGVAEVIRPNGTRAKLVTRYDDVVHLLRDQATFSRQAALTDDEVDVEGTILGLDGAEHTEVRSVVTDHFTPKAVEKIREQIERRAADHLASMLAQEQPVDMIEAFALPFALDTISDMLGLPQQDRRQFRQWGEAFLATSTLSRAEADAAQMAMVGYLAGLIEQRRAEPADDLLSTIATRGAHLPPDRVIKLPLALLVGGWETTASSIGTFTEVLLTHPYGGHDSAYGYLADRPEEVELAVTELERMYSTAAADAMPRRVMRDVVLPGGASLRAGELVIPSHDAANYDPRVFSDPQQMNLARTPNRRLSFGFGAHHCIGRHLGHLEVVTAIRLLTRELPTLRLAGEAVRKEGIIISGLQSLPVAWS
ncbi:cytochrome P450 [Nonomuraea dietziae]